MLRKEQLLGIKLLYTGELVVSTRFGKLMVIALNLTDYQLIDIGKPIDNSLAVDEQGGIYLTSFESILKYSWKNQRLTAVWQVQTNERTGSTPTLLGQSDDPEAFVAVTIHDHPMKLLLLWRNQIAPDWLGLPGYDRRVAALTPVLYGRTEEVSHFTENSLLAYGNSLVAVNFSGMLPRLQRQNPGIAKYTWNSATQQLVSNWTNPDIWIPNSMQAYSAGSQMIYAIAVSNRQYGLIGIDWNTGRERFFTPYGDFSQREYNTIGSGLQIGPGGEIITMSPSRVVLFLKR